MKISGTKVNTPRFSIVTCVSDYDVYERCLLSSLKRIKPPIPSYELIPIDNRASAYYASTALNLGIDIAKSDNIIFCHQDVSLMPDFFNHATSALRTANKKWGVIGCAGRAIGENDTMQEIGVVYNGHPGQYDDDYDIKLERSWDGDREALDVFCADECLFIYNKKTGIRFDHLIKGFHFYASDLCLSMIKNGKRVLATYLPIIHHGAYSSSLVIKNNYWQLFRNLVSKWKEDFAVFHGTHMRWNISDGFNKMSSLITIDAESQDFSAKVLYLDIAEYEHD